MLWNQRSSIKSDYNLTCQKGIITKQEYIDEMKELKEDMAAQGTVE